MPLLFEQNKEFFFGFKPFDFGRQILPLFIAEFDTPVQGVMANESRLHIELLDKGDSAEPQLPVADKGVSGEQCKELELRRVTGVVVELVIEVFIEDRDPTERGFKAVRTDAAAEDEFT